VPALPVTERAAAELVTLPISAAMTLDDAEYVTAEMRATLLAGVV
jgi:dTDP-4-amino-4,6-dideoxygalactose transaminase